MNIQQLKGIGEKTAALLSRLSVYTVKDLVGLYPRAYDVYEKPVFVQEAVEEHASEIVSIEAVVARNVEQYSTPRILFGVCKKVPVAVSVSESSS